MKISLTLVAFTIFSIGVDAATIEWNNTGSDYATGSDWVGGTAPANSTTTDIAAFGSTGAGPINPVLAAARSVGGVSFLTGAYTYTFSGATLRVGSNGIVNSATNTETFSNTVGPSISSTWSAASGATTVFNGTVDINGTTGAGRFLTFSGAGTSTINGVVTNSFAASTGNLTYSGTGILNLNNTNTYTGNTLLSGIGGAINATKDGAFGGGNLSLTGGTITLTLSGGATNNYIADTKSLSYVNTDTINLSYTGTDTVNTLFVDGISQAPGVYGAAFTNPDGAFSGTGTITVLTFVPEPSTYAMVGLGACLLILAQRARRKRA